MSGGTLDDLLANAAPATSGTDKVACILMDGDIVAYRAAAATDGRMYNITGVPGAWKYKSDTVKHCKEHDLSPADINLIFEPEPVEHALNACKTTMRFIEMTLMQHYQRYNIEVYLTNSKENFRNDVNPQYKANRVGNRKPVHLAACKEYLESRHGAKYPPNMEADDILAIRATECRNDGIPYVIVSMDKDLKQVPGDHYNWVSDEFERISETEGRRRLWTQVVMGDPTDGIGTPVGIGPAKAKKLFKDVDWNCISVVELEEMVTGLYSEFLGKNPKVRKDSGVPPVKDFTDVLCYVRQTHQQVYLLRSRDEAS